MTKITRIVEYKCGGGGGQRRWEPVTLCFSAVSQRECNIVAPARWHAHLEVPLCCSQHCTNYSATSLSAVTIVAPCSCSPGTNEPWGSEYLINHRPGYRALSLYAFPVARVRGQSPCVCVCFGQSCRREHRRVWVMLIRLKEPLQRPSVAL